MDLVSGDVRAVAAPGRAGPAACAPRTSPAPAAPPARPPGPRRTPPRRRSRGRASGTRRRSPAPAAPWRRAPRSPRPCRCRAARPGRPRSPGCPGSTTRSASASSAATRANRTRTPGSAASASMSVKLLIRGSRTTLTRSTSFPRGGPSDAGGPASSASESSASSHNRSVQGIIPNGMRPVSSCSIPTPGSSSSGAPRNLLITNPATSAWSAGSSRARVPCSAANTPPRSMSPTTITGRCAARASPMFAMSVARRLISAGLPAPSQITTSYSRRNCARLSVGQAQQPGGVLPVLGRVDLALRAPEHHHLAAPVAAGLEQHRVHPRVGLDARRRGLHGLGPADLGAVGGDERVQRHVLRLERGDAHPLPHEPAAQAGHEHALARVRRRARYQKRASHVRTPIAASAAAAATAVAAAAAVAAIVTARHRRTARRMSPGSGGRPRPRTGRCSAAPA